MVKNKLLNFCCCTLVCVICISFLFVFIKVEAYLNQEKIYLQGKIIYIDAGHGGKDNGASVDGVMEDAINMNISGYLVEELISSGAYVLVSRTGDYDLASMYQKNRKREDLYNRVRYINSSKPDLFISVHLNTFPDENVKGGQVFCQNNEESKLLAEFVQNEMNILSAADRKAKIGDYFILNNANYTGVLIECGFLSNSSERKKLNDAGYQNKIAKRIKKAIVKYFVDLK